MENHHLKIEQEQFKVPKKAQTSAYIIIGIGIVLTIIGFFMAKSKASSSESGHAINKHNTTILQSNLQENANTGAIDSNNLGTDSLSHQSDSNQATINANNLDENAMQVHTEHNAHSETITHNGEHHKPWYARVWAALLMNSYYIMLISLGGLFFICVQYVANAGWATALLRIPMAIQTFFLIPAAVVMLIIAFAGADLYHWIHYQHENIKEGLPGFDKLLDAKKWFLNPTFLFIVLPIMIIVWYFLGRRIMRLSKREDAEGGKLFYSKIIRTSAAFMVIFGFTFSLLAWLVVMSLDAHWFSTIFGIYHFAILWVSFLSVMMLITLFLRKHGYIKILTDEHIHDLGKFMFAFCVFWMYIWIAQYLLIWYANIPEESIYYMMRRGSAYDVFFIINIFFNFIIPFLLLMTRENKRNPKILVVAACSILFGHWIDIYLSIYPGAFNGEVIYPGFLEVGFGLIWIGIFILWVLYSLTKRGLISKHHPFIEESVTHNVGV